MFEIYVGVLVEHGYERDGRSEPRFDDGVARLLRRRVERAMTILERRIEIAVYFPRVHHGHLHLFVYVISRRTVREVPHALPARTERALFRAVLGVDDAVRGACATLEARPSGKYAEDVAEIKKMYAL